MRERELFLAALAEPPDARATFLDSACDGDAALKARVLQLLNDDTAEISLLSESPGELLKALDDAPAAEKADARAVIARYLAPPARSGSFGRLGAYEVLEILGEGAFGIVLKAFDETLQRVVAIKVLHPDLARTSPPRKRFLREARSAAAVTHENVVQVYAVHEQPLPHLVMEFVDGRSLQSQMDSQGPFEPEEIVRIGKQVAAGLAAAHEKGLVHRDIKPANLLLENGPAAKIKLTDFGLARTADAASITQSGVIAGTPLYMAPEQVHGRTLDGRADLFSLGSVLYALCTGHPPFRAPTTVAVLKRVSDDEPRPIRDVIPETPAGLVAVVTRLLQKDPEQRYATAADAAAALETCLTTVPRWTPPRRRRRLRPVAAVLAAALLLAAAGFGIFKLVNQPAAPLVTTPEDWLTRTRTLPAGPRVKAVCDRLAELNPGFAADQLQCEVSDGRVRAATFANARTVFDITPLQAFDALAAVDIRQTGVQDLKALAGLPLAEVSLNFRPAEHLRPLQVLALKTINGQPAAQTLAAPATLLHLPHAEWLADVKRLREPERWPHVVARLMMLNPGWDPSETSKLVNIKGDHVLGYGLCDGAKLKDLTPVLALPDIEFISPNGPIAYTFEVFRGFKLTEVYGETQKPDITPFTGMKLRTCWLNGYQGPWEPIFDMPLEDFRFAFSNFDGFDKLKNAKLRTIYAPKCGITSLKGLEGQPLESVDIQGTAVTDLAPLAGCRTLRSLRLWHTQVTDLTPIADLPIELLSIEDVKRNYKILKAMPKLITLNDKPKKEVLDAVTP